MWLAASLRLIRSSLSFNSLPTKSLTKELYLPQAGSSKLTSHFVIFWMVVEWYSDQKGVWPVTILKIVIPRAQRSILSSQPPPRQTSGAWQLWVPMTVSMSRRTPRWQVFLLMPKSMSLTVLLAGQQSMFSGLMSRWHIFRLCKYCKACTSCFTTDCISCSEARRASLRLGRSKHSMTSQAQCWLRSRQSARYLMMLGCRSSLRFMKFRFSSMMCYYQNLIFLAAQSLPVFKCWHLQTHAFAPSPSFSSSLYFLEKALRPQSSESSEFSDSLKWLP